MSKPTRKELVDLLKRIQAKHLRYPDSDGHEYCAGCGCSPYWAPPHTSECLVVELDKLLRRDGHVPNP